MMNALMPIAKSQGIVTQDMADELLVYDLKSNKAHCLNKTARFVWRNCDGTKSLEDIRRGLESSTGENVEIEIISLAVQQLNDNNLLDNDSAIMEIGLSRRALLKRAGFAAVIALPIVASIAVPSSVLASSSRAPSGSPCTSPVDCASGACLGSPGTCL
jgi:hypothetical protein